LDIHLRFLDAVVGDGKNAVDQHINVAIMLSSNVVCRMIGLGW
jgi:hypothetical protein